MTENINNPAAVELTDFSRHIEWDDNYLVHVKPLDDDHRHLLTILNNACDACASGSYQRYPLILNELIDYTRAHFDAEESYLTGLAYPELAEHSLEHRRFFEKIVGHRQEMADRNVFYSIELVELTQTIYGWWHHHILEVDRLYKEFAGHGS